MLRNVLLRLGLVIVALPTVATGGWALFAPVSWYERFPRGARHAWIAALGPYDEHLVRDVGALLLALGLLLLFAALVLERRLVQGALVASLVFGIPHLIFHAAHRSGLSSADNALNLTLLSVAVAIPAALLVLVRASSRTARSPPV